MENPTKKGTIKFNSITLVLIMGAALGCGGSGNDNETVDTATGTTDSNATDTSAPEQDGTMLISYEFSGLPNGGRRCVDTSFSDLFLNLIFEGDPQSTITWPCDDSSILVEGLPYGSWKMTLSTISNTETATEPYGLSSTFMTHLGSSDIMEPHLILDC